MLAATLVADVTDTPVWFLGSATAVLAGATIALAVFTRRALGQLKVAIRELEEVQRDREVAVFSDFGRRWESQEMTEALHIELEYSAEALRRLFTRAGHDPYRNPFKERRRLREARRRVVLLRVPNYFEDAAFIAKAGGLEGALFSENFGGVAVDEWRIWGPTIKLLQEEDPTAFEEFERLAKQVKEDDLGPSTSTSPHAGSRTLQMSQRFESLEKQMPPIDPPAGLTRPVSDWAGRLTLLGAELAYIALVAYLVRTTWHSPQGKVPDVSDAVAGTTAALATAFAIGYASVLGVPPAGEQIHGLNATAPVRFLRWLYSQFNLRNLLGLGVFMYMAAGTALGLTYLANIKEAPGVVKTISVAFGGYVIAYIGKAYRDYRG